MGFIWSFDGQEVANVAGVARTGPQNKFVEHTYPGVDGIDSVDHGFRGETITLQCWAVTQSPEVRVQEFRDKVGTVGVLANGRPGGTNIQYARLDNVSETGFEAGDDGYYTIKWTLILKQIKQNDA